MWSIVECGTVTEGKLLVWTCSMDGSSQEDGSQTRYELEKVTEDEVAAPLTSPSQSRMIL